MKLSGSTHSNFMRYRWTWAILITFKLHCHRCLHQIGLCFWKWRLWLQVYWRALILHFINPPKMCFPPSNVDKVTSTHNNFTFTTQGWKQYVCFKLFFLKYGIKSSLYSTREVNGEHIHLKKMDSAYDILICHQLNIYTIKHVSPLNHMGMI